MANQINKLAQQRKMHAAQKAEQARLAHEKKFEAQRKKLEEQMKQLMEEERLSRPNRQEFNDKLIAKIGRLFYELLDEKSLMTISATEYYDEHTHQYDQTNMLAFIDMIEQALSEYKTHASDTSGAPTQLDDDADEAPVEQDTANADDATASTDDEGASVEDSVSQSSEAGEASTSSYDYQSPVYATRLY